jgi:hypothetical protein
MIKLINLINFFFYNYMPVLISNLIKKSIDSNLFFKQLEDASNDNLPLIMYNSYLKSIIGYDATSIDTLIDGLSDLMKDELKSRVTILINKNPELKNELETILETLSYNNVSNEYIDEKISYIDELEKNTIHDYKSELYNLCLYLKNEILDYQILQQFLLWFYPYPSLKLLKNAYTPPQPFTNMDELVEVLMRLRG